MTIRPRLVRDAPLPPSQSVHTACPRCGLNVRLHITHEFAHVFKMVCALAGVRLAKDLPAFTYRCDRGHIVVMSLEKLGLAS